MNASFGRWSFIIVYHIMYVNVRIRTYRYTYNRVYGNSLVDLALGLHRYRSCFILNSVYRIISQFTYYLGTYLFKFNVRMWLVLYVARYDSLRSDYIEMCALTSEKKFVWKLKCEVCIGIRTNEKNLPEIDVVKTYKPEELILHILRFSFFI